MYLLKFSEVTLIDPVEGLVLPPSGGFVPRESVVDLNEFSAMRV